tara:strand:- start:3606 stop:4703 length:1098 start_codon:yes stop_codon:yes gene_type:complete
MKRNKIIISCGGTGGHIFPALEIAKSLQKINPHIELLFVGARNKMEMVRVPRAGFRIIGIWIQALYRNSIIKNLLFPIKLFVSLIHSCFILVYHRPVAVIGTGGFVTGPILFIASLLNFKTYIQEQNSFPGLTNKLLGKSAKKIFVAYDNMERFFSIDKIINIGNPVRKSLKTSADLKYVNKSRSFFGLSNNKFTILVIGGSLGAQPINTVIQKNLHKLIDHDCQLIWQTGSFEYQYYKNLKSKKCSIQSFIDRMDLAYSAADLVISRAGAIAITEISFLKKASILIPSPYVTDDHQKKNAQYLDHNDACILINESELMNTNLINVIEKLKSQEYRNSIGYNAWKLFKYNASNNIAKIIINEINN